MSLTTLNAYQQGGPVLDKLKQLWGYQEGGPVGPSRREFLRRMASGLGGLWASANLPGIGDRPRMSEAQLDDFIRRMLDVKIPPHILANFPTAASLKADVNLLNELGMTPEEAYERRMNQGMGRDEFMRELRGERDLLREGTRREETRIVRRYRPELWMGRAGRGLLMGLGALGGTAIDLLAAPTQLGSGEQAWVNPPTEYDLGYLGDLQGGADLSPILNELRTGTPVERPMSSRDWERRRTSEAFNRQLRGN